MTVVTDGEHQLLPVGLGLYENAYTDGLPFRNPMLTKAIAYIRANISTVTVADMAAQLAVSERTLRNLYYRYTVESPLQVLQSMRMKEAKHLLESSSYTVNEISERLGYKSTFYFSRLFKSVHNISPTEYRKRSNQYQTLYVRKYKK